MEGTKGLEPQEFISARSGAATGPLPLEAANRAPSRSGRAFCMAGPQAARPHGRSPGAGARTGTLC
jgi:hypothetical protein